ncbi:MAG: hypothetical protein ABIH23_08665 [bacterium]
MGSLILLVKAILDLVSAIIDLPDWTDEDSIEAWIDGFQDELARVIVLLTPAGVMANVGMHQGNMTESIESEFRGKQVEDLDWKVVIDWVVNLLCTLFPEAAAIIQIVGTILKQLIDILKDEFARLSTATQALCKELLEP